VFEKKKLAKRRAEEEKEARKQKRKEKRKEVQISACCAYSEMKIIHENWSSFFLLHLS
jgi:hypothetical protein